MIDKLELVHLRTLLGDPLYVRTGHGMAPTPYARLIAPHVSQVLAHLNAIPLPSTLQPGQTERTLVVSGTDYTQKVIVADLVRDLRRQAPRIKVAVVGIEVAELGRKMQHGEIDLVFTVDGSVAPGLVSRPLFLEQYRCVSANPALAGRTLTPQQLVEHDFLVTSPGGAHFRGSSDAWFARQGLQRRVVAAVPTFFMALEYLKGTDLVAFMPSRLLPCDGLVEVGLSKSPPGFAVVAACHPSAQGDPLMAWVLDRVAARLA